MKYVLIVFFAVEWGGAAAGYNPSFTNGPAAVSFRATR